MALSSPPAAPQRGDRTTFASRVDAFITWLIGFVYELNIFSANMNSIAFGGAYALPYTFSALTARADPGLGFLRLSPTNDQIDSTGMYFDPIGSNGKDYTSIIQTFGTSTSGKKGTIRLVKVNDPSKFLMFDVVALSAYTGYYELTLVSLGGSSASPFSNGDSLMLFFQRTGDKGDTNSGQPTLHLREERASGTNSTAPTNLGTGVNRRPLNTVKVNTVTGASLASDQFVLPAGTYDVEAESLSLVQTGTPGIKYWNKMALYNVTDGTYAVIGLNGLSWDPTGGNAYAQLSPPSLAGTFTIAASKTFELRHLTPNAVMAAVPASSSGQVEVYTDLVIRKTS